MNDTPIKPGKKMRARYRTPEEIAAKAAKAHVKATNFATLAALAEAKSKEYYRLGEARDGGFWKEKAAKLWKQHDYQIEKRLPLLKDRMAAIQTDLLPWEGNNDKSVTA